MKQLLLVFIGGGFGSMARYILAKYFNDSSNGIPYGTFLANVLGSLFIGFVLGMAVKNEALNSNQTLLLATGFCGGFTTFSTFTYENQVFLKSGDFGSFFLYSIGSFALGLAAVFFGMYLVKLL
jgi:CrcB protein